MGSGQTGDIPGDRHLRDKALRLLTVRDRTRAELAERLQREGEAGEVEAVVQWLERLGYVDDRRFAQEWVRQRRGRYGPLRLEAELRSKGLDSAVIREAMARYGDDHDELEAALALVRRRLSRMRGEADGEARERWRRRLVAMLCRRGFLVEVAERAVRQAMDGLNQEAGGRSLTGLNS